MMAPKSNKSADMSASHQAVLDQVVAAKGDLARLSDAARAEYYRYVCESVGLNPLTQPFGYIILNGKLSLYAYKACSDQLRDIHNVSIYRLETNRDDDLYEVVVYARNGAGREDVDMGAVSLAAAKGETLGNAKMRAITKAKRRVTLSICGLGWLDETEVETLPGAALVDVSDAGKIQSATPVNSEPLRASKPAEEKPAAAPVSVPVADLKPLREQIRTQAKQMGLPADQFLRIIKAAIPSGKLPEGTEAELNKIQSALRKIDTKLQTQEKEAA